MKKNQPYKPKKFDIGVIEETEDATIVSYPKHLQIFGHFNNLHRASSSLVENLHPNCEAIFMVSGVYPTSSITMILDYHIYSSTYSTRPTLYFICDKELNLREREDIIDHILRMEEYDPSE